MLLESRDPVFDRNGILEAQTLLFDLLSVYDLEFEYMSFQCEVDLCTQKQYCRDVSISYVDYLTHFSLESGDPQKGN